MKKSVVYLLIMLFVFPTLNLYLFSQEEPGKDEEKKEPEIEYRLKVKYDPKIYNSYKLTESNDVTRVYSDSSTVKYNRTITYFFTLYAPDPPEDGFLDVDVAIDSMRYKLVHGEKVYEYDTQRDIESKFIFDREVASVPSTKEFRMIYSPYGEVAEISGDMLDFETKKLFKYGDRLDTLKKFVWYRGLSPEHLAYLVDVPKGLLPYGPVAEDSIWAKPVKFDINGIAFSDTMVVRINEHSRGTFLIEAAADSLTPIESTGRLYQIKELAQIRHGVAKGTFEMELIPSGVIGFAEAKLKGVIYPKVKKEEFKEYVDTKITWELLGQFRFK